MQLGVNIYSAIVLLMYLIISILLLAMNVNLQLDPYRGFIAYLIDMFNRYIGAV